MEDWVKSVALGAVHGFDDRINDVGVHVTVYRPTLFDAQRKGLKSNGLWAAVFMFGDSGRPELVRNGRTVMWFASVEEARDAAFNRAKDLLIVPSENTSACV
jgi:hypothetical protein